MSAQDNVTLMRNLADAYNARDLDRLASFATENCELLDVPMGIVFRGPEGVRQFSQGFMTAFPDGKVEVTNVFATDNQGTLEFTGRGTNTGPLSTPTGQIPPTGRKLDLRFCNVCQFSNGKISSQHTYYDALGMLQQLGLIATTGEASA